jgi:hypothetical protein
MTNDNPIDLSVFFINMQGISGDSPSKWEGYAFNKTGDPEFLMSGVNPSGSLAVYDNSLVVKGFHPLTP